MIKTKGMGLFGKTLLYMFLFLLAVICVTSGLFARQFLTTYDAGQKQQLMDTVQPLCDELEGKAKDEITRLAKAYHEKNTSVQFSIQTKAGEMLYETPLSSTASETGHDLPPLSAGDGSVAFNSMAYIFPLSDDITLSVYYASDNVLLMEILAKTALAFGILLLITVLGVVIFARGITNPIRKLADDTTKMSNLDFVPPPVVRKDEIGRLANDVHKMYEHLKKTIANLENEIERKKEMEESQRYFFSAASHELKTPVASASTILESMIEGWVEPSEYPKYLRECLKMMNMQGKLITEIMDIVRLTDGKMQFDIQLVSLGNIIESALPSYQPLSDAKEQKITVSIPDTLMCGVDRHMLSRVISNILMNAIQNTPEHGEIRIWSDVRENGRVRLSLVNTNTHISEELISKLYEPFYRMDKARNKNQGHSGLGLTIVKKALDCMEIPFSIENNKEGVIFWMDLPTA